MPDPESVRLWQDPAVPMIALPFDFTTRRANANGRIPAEGSVDLARLRGPGCVRHAWILADAGSWLEIHVDNAAGPQVNVPLDPFFGIMGGLNPYPVDCAAFTVLPNPAPGIPGNPGYNLFLPIPFAESCRITLRGPEGACGTAMVDWHQYDSAENLPPWRFHADYRSHAPAPERGGFVEVVDVEGDGFVAGIVAGYFQRNHRDMVFHTGGMTILIDGETKPNAIRGHNVEDDFGFTWGFNDQASRWVGCPWHVNRSRCDQEGVFYRFFGPDPIRFRSSLLFRTGCREDNMETMVYYYRTPGSDAPRVESPSVWQVAGVIPVPGDWGGFSRGEFAPGLPAGPWPERVSVGGHDLHVATLEAAHAWIDLQNALFERHHTATPLTIVDHAAFARTTLRSDAERRATLRLAVDDWCLVWLNGEQVATLRHEDGLETVRIPITLRRGENELLLANTNSAQSPNNRLWVVNVVVEP